MHHSFNHFCVSGELIKYLSINMQNVFGTETFLGDNTKNLRETGSYFSLTKLIFSEFSPGKENTCLGFTN